MENEFSQFSDQLRLETTMSLANLSIGGGDTIWGDSFLANRRRPEDRRNFDSAAVVGAGQIGSKQPHEEQLMMPPLQSVKPSSAFDFNAGTGWKAGIGGGKSAFADNTNNTNVYFNKEIARPGNYFNREINKPANNSYHPNHRKNNNFNNNNDAHIGKGKKNGGGYNNININNNNNKSSNNEKTATDKRFKTLPASEALPRSEAVGGYIFVCNNDTMPENLHRQLFGLPPRYRDSVRAITPGLPLFLYNYSTHQLHGIFEAASFGGTNIDPTAWEDKKCSGESRFPAQVRVVTRKNYEPLEEDSFRPILHHYDGPKFRLELNVPEALALLDIFAENNA